MGLKNWSMTWTITRKSWKCWKCQVAKSCLEMWLRRWNSFKITFKSQTKILWAQIRIRRRSLQTENTAQTTTARSTWTIFPNSWNPTRTETVECSPSSQVKDPQKVVTRDYRDHITQHSPWIVNPSIRLTWKSRNSHHVIQIEQDRTKASTPEELASSRSLETFNSRNLLPSLQTTNWVQNWIWSKALWNYLTRW